MDSSEAVVFVSEPENGARTTTSATRAWYAVYTRARHEKAVDRLLQDKDVESFLPLHDILSRWKDRKVWVQKPLFPGYLFVHVVEGGLGDVWRTRGVVHVVGDGESAVAVPDEQVEAVRQMIESPVKVDPWPYMRKGKVVRVKTGPLTGMEGYIVRRKGTCRLVISVDLLGRSVATEIGAECVDVV